MMRFYEIVAMGIAVPLAIAATIVLLVSEKDEPGEIYEGYEMPVENPCKSIDASSFETNVFFDAEIYSVNGSNVEESANSQGVSCLISLVNGEFGVSVTVPIHVEVETSSTWERDCNNEIESLFKSYKNRYEGDLSSMNQSWLDDNAGKYDSDEWISSSGWHGDTFGSDESTFDFFYNAFDDDLSVDSTLMSCHENLFIEVGYFLESPEDDADIDGDEIIEMLAEIRNYVHTSLF